MTTSGGRTPFVGRRHELGALGERLGVVGEGRGAVALVAGEAGIGKTRLLEELAADARLRGFDVLWGRCYEEEGVPAFWPWVQIVRARVTQPRQQPEALRRALGPGGAEIAQLVPALRELFPHLPAPPPLDPAQARFRLFDSLTDFFRQLARQHPLLLLLDDLHWADEASLRLLQFLASELREEPLLVLGAYREDEVGPDHPLTPCLAALRRLTGFERVALKGLDAGAVGDLVQELLCGREPPAAPDAAIGAAVHRATGGNPFFVVETVRHLAEAGRLKSVVETAEATARTGALGVAEGVRDVLARRLGRISPPGRQALAGGAVLGREFDVQVLASALGLGTYAVVTCLDEAIQAGLIVQVSETPPRRRFAHDLVRETVYQALPPVERAAWHARVAGALERLDGAGAQRTAEIAHHALYAGTHGDLPRAVRWATAAAREANAALAYEEAACLYERLLAVAEFDPTFDPRERCLLLLDAAEAHHGAGNRGAARQACLRVAEIARRLDAEAGAPLLARAALDFGRDIDAMGVTDDVLLSLLEEAAERLEAGDPALRARVMARLAEALRWTNTVRGDRLSREAIALARAHGDPSTLLFCLCCRRYLLGDPAQAAERLAGSTEVVELAQQAGDREAVLQGLRWRVADLVGVGDMAAADAALDLFDAQARQLRQPYFRWWVAVFRCMRAWLTGPIALAERLAAEAMQLGVQAHQPDAKAFYLFQLMLPRLAQGRLDELFAPMELLADRYVAYRTTLAWTYAEHGWLEKARLELERLAPNRFAAIPHDGNWLMNMDVLGRVAAITEHREHAATLYDLLHPFREHMVVSSNAMACVGSSERALGLLAWTLGDLPRAREHFEAALRHNEQLGVPTVNALIRREYALALMRLGGRDELPYAKRLLHDGLEAARRLGLDSFAERIEAAFEELRAHAAAPDVRTEPIELAKPRPVLVAATCDAGRAARAGQDGRTSLTERELEVLRLIAEGRTNREIADQLVLSAGTVRRHTHNIYTKLDVRGRADAVVWAVRLGLIEPTAV